MATVSLNNPIIVTAYLSDTIPTGAANLTFNALYFIQSTKKTFMAVYNSNQEVVALDLSAVYALVQSGGGGGTGLTWSSIAVSTTLVGENGYILNNSSPITLTLPIPITITQISIRPDAGNAGYTLIASAGQNLVYPSPSPAGFTSTSCLFVSGAVAPIDLVFNPSTNHWLLSNVGSPSF